MTREELERRVCRVRQELEEAAGDRWPVPKLIAVTKTHSAEEILPLKEIGVTEIGENRVQELKGKLPELQGRFGIHLIGRLQRNKVRQIIHDVCMIQSVDSVPLAEEIHTRARTAGGRGTEGRRSVRSDGGVPEGDRAAGRNPGARPDGGDAADG